MAKISVIIPTYNREKVLKRSILSVLKQTYVDLELIIVDDNSNDNTENIVRKCNDNRIKYIRHDSNRGGSAARNTGIKASKGEYIAFQDSDDEWVMDKLEKQMQIFENGKDKIDIVFSAYYQFINDDINYIPSQNIIEKNNVIFPEILKQNFIGTPTVILRRECFCKAGLFDERLPRFQDWELWIRMSKFYKFRFINEALVNAYVQKDSITKNKDAGITALKLIIDKYYYDIEKNKKILSHLYRALASMYLQNQKYNCGKRYLIKALKYYPLNFKAYIELAISMLFHEKYEIVRENIKNIKYKSNIKDK